MGLDLYEDKGAEPVAVLDREGQVCTPDGTRFGHLDDEGEIDRLPRILFADIPTEIIHLSVGISIARKDWE